MTILKWYSIIVMFLLIIIATTTVNKKGEFNVGGFIVVCMLAPIFVYLICT